MRALCILHDAYSTTGLIGQALRARGWDVDELLVVPAERFEAPGVELALPDHRDYDLLVPMGAPWSAYDDALIGSWLAPELAWIADAVHSGGAVFGICFGAQAMARALGGSVARGPRPEIGWTAIESEDGSWLDPGPWFQWHFDALTPPPGATVLARTSVAVQAYQLGRSFGVQFHPEVAEADISMWLGNGGESVARAEGVDPAVLLAEAAREREASRVRAGALLDAYLGKIFPA
ncbi:aminotransferase [Actinospica durhamensis]|uniref:Aminotransferase n=1 Tax=Actinospica durhamensis TaxID=1508375 RepID=A0A941EWU6_9ACTN|nr:type 1 glutamine amidotransferase [Actinospica durhamensis]MBR7838726.1 aminotransferase [Actinospica durhamensis]